MAETDTTPSPLASEDWLACWLSLALLVLLLAGVRFDLPALSWSPGPLADVFAPGNLLAVLAIGALLMVVAAIGVALMRERLRPFLIGFPAVFGLGLAAQFIAGNAGMKAAGLTYVITGLGLGLLISNLFRLPGWLLGAVRTEFYIKIGLVILGSNILLGDILEAGVLGIAQAALVILVIWYVGFWIAKRLKLDDDFAAMLATAVSICGVSAAIAACGVLGGDRRKLSYVTSLVLVVAVPMMLAMPWIIDALDMPALVGGAWIGGTIDTSGAVVAAGELVGESAMNAAVIVKFSQNAMLGIAAFALSIWWTLRSGEATGEKPSARIIWERFPKFVVGFMAASAIFSFLLSADFVESTADLTKGLRTWWFTLAFVCIGLETRFRDLVRMDGGRPAAAFLAAQGVNIAWTLVVAWLLFGGVLFAVPSL